MSLTGHGTRSGEECAFKLCQVLGLRVHRIEQPVDKQGFRRRSPARLVDDRHQLREILFFGQRLQALDQVTAAQLDLLQVHVRFSPISVSRPCPRAGSSANRELARQIPLLAQITHSVWRRSARPAIWCGKAIPQWCGTQQTPEEQFACSELIRSMFSTLNNRVKVRSGINL